MSVTRVGFVILFASQNRSQKSTRFLFAVRPSEVLTYISSLKSPSNNSSFLVLYIVSVAAEDNEVVNSSSLHLPDDLPANKETTVVIVLDI